MKFAKGSNVTFSPVLAICALYPATDISGHLTVRAMSIG